MFDTLSEKLGGILDKLTRRGALREADVDEAMREVRRALLEAEKGARRVFWKDVPELTRQLGIWRGPLVERLVERLMDMHQRMLANSHDSELLLAQGLAQIVRAASAAAKRR